MNSKTYLEFNQELEIMVRYLQDQANIKRLNITEQQLSELSENQLDFSTIMAAYTNPDEKTETVVKQTKQTYQATHKWTADFRQAIKAFNKGKLTEQDYKDLGIHENKTPSKHTKPDTKPILKLEHIEPGNARIGVHHYATHDKGTKPGRPQGVDSIEWQWTITNDQATSALVYDNHKTTESANLKLGFDDTQIAQFCHIKARYAINNGEAGVYSSVFSFAIT